MSPSRLIATTIITIGVVLCIFMFFEIEYILQVPQRLFTKQDSTAIEQQQKVVAFTTGGEKKLAKCIASAPGFTQSESCYSEFKHDILMAFLDNMEKLSEDESSKFQALDHYSPHQILIPTHECDFLKLQRMGDHAYGTKPGDQHPDGPKWMCPEYLDVNDGECVIFSVGSNGDFQFEESMRKFVGDRCKIYTFDCTGAWSNPATHFLPWCIADSNHEGDDGKIYKTFSEIMGLLGVKKVSVLKIDVEGFEFPFIDGMMKENRDLLPKEVLMEVHFTPRLTAGPKYLPSGDSWLPMATKFYRDIDKLGYRIALRELNIYDDCCAEYILIHDDVL